MKWEESTKQEKKALAARKFPSLPINAFPSLMPEFSAAKSQSQETPGVYKTENKMKPSKIGTPVPDQTLTHANRR